MNFIWIWHAKTLKKSMIIAIAAFFTAGILYVETPELAVFSTGDKPVAIYKAETEEKKVALTFNISWGEEKAVPILDTLKEHNISETTFFVSAAWAERHPEIIERILEDGHEIGNHGFRHEHYTSWEEDKIKSDIQTAHRIIEEVTQEAPKYLRPPNGSFDERVLKIAETLNYDVIHWSINSEDWQNPGVEKIVENVTSNTASGDIILLHASDSAKQTNEALPEIIKTLENDGFQFATVSQLISGAEAEAEEIK
ncbi:polysaccharide deacetylase family sporulation protein PdaB [Evansella sp. LMS18]|jgi:polysaccharide deacetylase family sporulation protein PdaB|uniref:polysaccharide deacetylase family sporulation protein PdaB n=1 Tax=Evansella sp. LMS18 TaxID=2924033 RepID=UPI0020D17C68|nr:polysaccharide deacetylase family sporulation protein PdaB [Evansella sp. LMS18]UTR12559.1 polysaccharide deacetylase family sporulation protein PdaB [Evansella sp. LMS18]